MKTHSVSSLKKFAKGHRGIIYMGFYHGKKVAVKKKNPASEAKGRIQNEVKFLKLLNEYGIGPKLIFSGRNYFVYEFIDGDFICDYIAKSSKLKIKNVLLQILVQCSALDKLKINKEEMHHPFKHIIINKNNKAHLVDFERAHYTKKPHNVTQFLQCIAIMKSALAEKKIDVNKQKIRWLAKRYKKDYNFKLLQNELKICVFKNAGSERAAKTKPRVTDTDYEERELTCIGCGKKIKRVILKKKEEKTFLCQQCGKA